MRPSHATLLSTAAITVVVTGVIFACGPSVNGTDACRKIEHARCGWVVACNISLPVARKEGYPVDDCIRYYDDACEHGLVTPVSPTKDQIDQCVGAINAATDCTIVTAPETADACAWLIPPDAGLDGAAD
jgi:hypothetical protein